MPFPWLVKQEWLHYGYALVMLIGLIILRPGFVGRARTWWTIALAIQVWHHFEHLLLLIQAQTHTYLLGRKEPTSLLQLFFPRVEPIRTNRARGCRLRLSFGRSRCERA